MQLLRSMAGLALLTAALVTNLEVALADSNGPPVVAWLLALTSLLLGCGAAAASKTSNRI